MANVYSRLLWEVPATSGQTANSPTVPAGVVWVVRSLAVTPAGITIGSPGWWRLVDGTATILASSPTGFGCSGVTEWFDIHQIVNSGDFLSFLSNSIGFSIRVSGYALTLP